MAKLKLSAPWIIFYREIEAMFQGDPDGVFFCTDTADNNLFNGERIGAPLGEWP